jgi:hypothetical protein
VLQEAANQPDVFARGRSQRSADISPPYGRQVNPNRKPQQFRRPSAFPWWLWVVAPLAVIGAVGILLVVT